VEQGAPGCLAHTHRLLGVEAGPGPHMSCGQLRIGHQLLDRLQAGHDLHQPGVVVGKAGEGYPAGPLAKFAQFLVGPGGANGLAHIQAGQGTHPIDPARIPQGFVVREFQIAPGFHRLPQERGVVVLPEAVGHDRPIRSAEADGAFDVFPEPLGGHQSHEQA
jgi:hypothetical protein